MLRFRGLSFLNVILLALSIGVILTIYAYFADEPTIKSQESNLTLAQKLRLYLLRFVHYSTILFGWCYSFFAKLEFSTDLVVFTLHLLSILQRKYYGECILSIIEKRILDPSYVKGSTPKYEPFWSLIDTTSHNIQTIENRYNFVPLIILLLRLVYTYSTKQ